MDSFKPIPVSEVVFGNHFFITINRFEDDEGEDAFGAIVNIVAESFENKEKQKHALSIAMGDYYTNPYDAAGFAIECAAHICDQYVDEIIVIDIDDTEAEPVALDVTVTELMQQNMASAMDESSEGKVLH